MAWQRAFSTLGCPDLDLAQVVALAKAHRCPGLELRALAGSLDLPAALQKAAGTPAALIRRLRGAAVTVVSLDTSLRLVGNTALERESLLAYVPWAEGLGVAHLRVFDGGRTADDAELSQAAATLKWWRDLRAAQGWKVDLMVETHDSLFTAAAIERLVAIFPDVKILWDAHHTWRQGGEDPLVTWRRIQRQVVHIHLKDSVTQPTDGLRYTYVLPGTGEFPAAGLLATLRGEFDGVLSLEWERYWHPGLPPLEKALEAAARNGWWT